MSKLKNIFKQAQKNEKLQQQGKLATNDFYVNTKGMSYKDFKNLMKQKGLTANDKEAKSFFYTQLDPDVVPVEQEEIIQKPVLPSYEEYYDTKKALQTPIVLNPITPKVIKQTTSKIITKPVQTSQPQKIAEITKVAIPANSGNPNYYGTINSTKYTDLLPQFDWNKANEEAGGLTPEQVQNYLKYQKYLENHSHKHYMFPASWGAYTTHYFQKGGSVKQTNNQQDAVMQFVQALAEVLKTDPNQVVQAAQANPEALKSAVQVYQQTQDIQQAAQTFAQTLQQKTQAAKHGAKLNYLKSLKNKCAEDEELYYFKKGGKAGCGCKKKEDGGKVEDKKESVVSKFKKACGGSKMKFKDGGKSIVKNDSIPPNNAVLKFKKTILKKEDKLDPETTKVLPNGKYPSYWTADDKIKWERKFGPKDEGAHYAKEEKCGGKMKKHQQGGSLNGIPFMQKGKDLPTAPKAEDRYKEGRREFTIVYPYDRLKYGFSATQPIRKVHKGSASISEIIKNYEDGTPADTMYYEIPNHLPFVEVKPRYAFSYSNNLYSRNPEYEILKRRFNTAWNLAK